ncbi:MAG: DUF6941 family protein, partial [Egibacteraceae bacterium]
MAAVDYALLCDYVRVEGGVAHIIAAGIDTIYSPKVPTGHRFGLLAGFRFVRNECGRPHRVDLILQTTDGQHLANVHAGITPEWTTEIPLGWEPVAESMGVALQGWLSAAGRGCPVGQPHCRFPPYTE